MLRASRKVYGQVCSVKVWQMTKYKSEKLPSAGTSSSGFNKSQVNGLGNHSFNYSATDRNSSSPRLLRAEHMPDPTFSTLYRLN